MKQVQVIHHPMRSASMPSLLLGASSLRRAWCTRWAGVRGRCNTLELLAPKTSIQIKVRELCCLIVSCIFVVLCCVAVYADKTEGVVKVVCMSHGVYRLHDVVLWFHLSSFLMVVLWCRLYSCLWVYHVVSYFVVFIFESAVVQCCFIHRLFARFPQHVYSMTCFKYVVCINFYVNVYIRYVDNVELVKKTYM